MHKQIPRAWVNYMTTNTMKAVCTHNDGNDFDHKVGDIVNIEDLCITRIWREGREISTSDKNKPGYHKSQDILRSMLKKGDEIENNYCHGQYRIL